MALSSTFSAAGVSTNQYVTKGTRIAYAITGTFVATVFLEFSDSNGASWEQVDKVLSAARDGGGFVAERSGLYRFRCDPYTSGTATYVLTPTAQVLDEKLLRDGSIGFRRTEDGIDVLVRPSQKRIINGNGKVGATSGWVTAPADDLGLLATLPAEQTASTLVVRIPGLKVGDTITGFHLIGQIESAGGAVTLDAALRKLTAAATDVTDALVGAITQLAVTADTIISAANSAKSSLAEVVGADETFYILITGTTAALTDIALQGVAITVTEG
jgi:hypothetical protein